MQNSDETPMFTYPGPNGRIITGPVPAGLIPSWTGRAKEEERRDQIQNRDTGKVFETEADAAAETARAAGVLSAMRADHTARTSEAKPARRLTVTIDLRDGENDDPIVLAEIVERLTVRLACGAQGGKIHDANGNTVGRFDIQNAD